MKNVKVKVESIHIHVFGDVFIFAEPKIYLQKN